MKDTQLLSNEIWERFGTSSYLFSNKGRVYSEKTNGLLNPFVNSVGYYRVDLRINNETVPINIHRVVAEIFKPISNSINLVVNHIDGNKLNNDINNLEWVSQAENCKHAYEIGLREGANKHSIIAIKKSSEEKILFSSVKEASEILKVDRSSIYKILKGKQKTANGYSFIDNDTR